MTGSAPACPLCGSDGTALHFRDDNRDFWRCTTCALVFVPPHQRPTFDDEVARYRHHNNDASDAGYRAFLSKLKDAVVAATPDRAVGLDYGSGPSDALARLLGESGRPTFAFDPEFRPRTEVLERQYDFITCSEVLEHVHRPLEFVQRVTEYLRPGGLLAVMTGMTDDVADFGDWWYRRDNTHVCFYHTRTMQWIATRFGWTVSFPAANIALVLTGSQR